VTTVKRRRLIEEMLVAAFEPLHLEVIDDSANHAGHEGARGGPVTTASASFPSAFAVTPYSHATGWSTKRCAR